MTVASSCPADATTPDGAPGTVGGPAPSGVTGADATDGAPVPTLFVARTVKVYGVPFVKPVTVHESGPDPHPHV